MLALALVAAEYALHYNIFLQAIPHDTTYHIYAAQQILEGHAIYRDVAIIKAPLSDFATAFALVVGRLLDISDIMSARLMSLLAEMATVCVTYWSGRVLFRSRAVGLIAGLILAGWDFYGLRAVTGPEPKAFLILFALPAFVFIAQKRWLLAGGCAALATLSWQPALMVAALAGASAFIAPWLETKRDPAQNPWHTGFMQALRVAGGFALPFGIVALYLGLNNALVPAWNATVGANVTHFNNMQARTPLPQMIADNFDEIFFIDAPYCFSRAENWLALTSGIGFLGIVVSQIIAAARAKRVPINLELTPLILYTLGFMIFTLIDFDYCPDLIPLAPIAAMCTGWLAWSIARGTGAFVEKHFMAMNARFIRWGILTCIIVWIGGVYLLDVRNYELHGVDFTHQLYVIHVARSNLGPNDTVLTFGNAIILVELKRQNASKIIHLGSKSGLGVLTYEPGGFQGMLDNLERNPPKLISLARENHLDWQKPFYDWLEQNYDLLAVIDRANTRLYIRKAQ